jgi:predicted membrane metal-binding protein
MELKINASDIRWWFWAITLVFIIAAIAGWEPGYYVVMAISAVQVLFFLAQEKSLVTFPSQIRVVYFAFTLFGLWPEVRLYIYIILLLGTVMVTFFGRCSIALVLKHMPWNRGREVRLN